MIILIDNREHETEEFIKRRKSFGCESFQSKLSFGDYTAYVKLPNGKSFTLADKVVIERKMDLTELASCYTSQRERFTKEFERAKERGAKIYLLVEDATQEKAYKGLYRSKMSPSSFVGSLTTQLARYDCQLIMCHPDTTGKLIHDILVHEMREALKNISDEGDASHDTVQ